MERVRFEELRPDLWPAVERLFGPNGACGGCRCMFWRSQSRKAWNEMRGAGAKRAFRKLVQNGKASGVLAFVEDEPVGWCSFGPRSDFPVLETVRAYRLSPSFAWTGPLTIFEELSFKRVVDSNPLKPVVRLRLKKLFEHFWGAVAAD